MYCLAPASSRPGPPYGPSHYYSFYNLPRGSVREQTKKHKLKQNNSLLSIFARLLPLGLVSVWIYFQSILCPFTKPSFSDQTLMNSCIRVRNRNQQHSKNKHNCIRVRNRNQQNVNSIGSSDLLHPTFPAEIEFERENNNKARLKTRFEKVVSIMNHVS